MKFWKVLKKEFKGLLPKVWGGDNHGFLDILSGIGSALGIGSTIAGLFGGASEDYPEYIEDPRIAAMLDEYYPNWQSAMKGEFGLPREMMDLIRGRAEEDMQTMYFGRPETTRGGYGGLAGKVAEYANRMGTYGSPGSMGELLTREVYNPYGEGIQRTSESIALQDYLARYGAREKAMGSWSGNLWDMLTGRDASRMGYETGKYGAKQDFWGGLTNLGMQGLGMFGGGFGGFGGGFGGGGQPLSGLPIARSNAFASAYG